MLSEDAKLRDVAEMIAASKCYLARRPAKTDPLALAVHDGHRLTCSFCAYDSSVLVDMIKECWQWIELNDGKPEQAFLKLPVNQQKALILAAQAR